MSRVGRFNLDFDVLSQTKEWDKETQDVVTSRTSNDVPPLTLRQHELDTLTSICSILLGDDRSDILAFVISHIDTKMRIGIGESERNINMPPFQLLVHKGIQAWNTFCSSKHGHEFAAMDSQIQLDFITSLIVSPVPFQVANYEIQSKDFLDRIHTEAVSAYFSHPTIWSEIGYAGPAYPRGYVRIERGLTDPWEAKSPHAHS